MNDILPPILVGFTSSVITELFKICPWISETDGRKKATAFLVTLGVTAFFLSGLPESPKDSLGFFILALTTSYGTFKTIFQGLEGNTTFGKLVGKKV